MNLRRPRIRSRLPWAPALIAALLLSVPARGDDPPPGAPDFEDFRIIQYTYSELDGGLLFLEWKTTGGCSDCFHRMQIWVDGEFLFVVPGELSAAVIPSMPVGSYEFTLVGVGARGRATTSLHFAVLPVAPMPAVDFLNSLAFGFDRPGGTGLLQLAWSAIDPPGDPIVEFEVEVLGPDVLDPDNFDFFWRLDAPESELTVAEIREGPHQVKLTAVTRSYASLTAEFNVRVEAVPSPSGVSLDTRCHGGSGAGWVTYQAPAGSGYDAVGVWVTSAALTEFRGYFNAFPRSFLLPGLPAGPVEVDVAGARFERGADEPYAISNLPGRPGAHAVGGGEVRQCEGVPEFLRGDATGDGKVNLSDPVRILGRLFFAAGDLTCPDAADVDDSGRRNLSDAVALLTFLYQGGAPPPEPGPFLCGDDPRDDDLPECSHICTP